MRSSNPALSENTFTNVGHAYPASGQTMSLTGTVNKTLILLVLAVITASFTWAQAQAGNPQVFGLMIAGLIGGFIVALVTIYKPEWAPVTAPIYALLEGLLLGGISGLRNLDYPDIVVQAVALTFGTLLCLLVAYQTRLIQATEKFKLGVVAATGAICLVYLVSIGLRLFGIQFPYIHDSGPIGIGFSLVVVVVAALNLVLDFDFIEEGTRNGLPAYMEWYGGFSLMVTLVWLYLEILRLLAKLRGSR